jgi:hypothetical protein
MDLIDEVENTTDVIPDKARVRRAYTYVVAVAAQVPDTVVLHEFDDTNGGRRAAMKYVNDIGHEKVVKVYKVKEPIELKVQTQVKVSF